MHFTSESYDFIKFRGKVKGNTLFHQKQFNSKGTKHFFERVGQHKNPTELIVANLLVDPKMFIIDIANKGDDNYKKYVDRRRQLYYNVRQELENYSLAELSQVNESGIPNIIQGYVAGKTSAESVVLIDACIKKLDTWKTLEHPILQSNILKLRKYRSFVKIDSLKLKKSFTEAYQYS